MNHATRLTGSVVACLLVFIAGWRTGGAAAGNRSEAWWLTRINRKQKSRTLGIRRLRQIT